MMDNISDRIVLSGRDVVLRPYCREDFYTTYTAVKESLTQLSRWMPWCHMDYGPEDHQRWSRTRKKQWDQGVEYDFVIYRPDTNLPLGICGLNNFDRLNRRANLGYWVRTSQTGQGLATAAAGLLAQFGFDTLKLNRIEILIAEENRPSQRVAEKLGLSREGLLKERLILNQTAHNAYLYAWLSSEFNENTVD